MKNKSIHSLNSFVSLADDQLITMTVAQFRDAVAYAVKEAIQPLQARVSALEGICVRLQEENAALASTQAHLIENQEIQLRLIKDRRSSVHVEPQGTKTLTRIAKIDEVLKARGATTLKELERLLKISPKEMNRILDKLDMRRYELDFRSGDAREKVLRLKAQIR